MTTKIHIHSDLLLLLSKLPGSYIVGGYIRDLIMGRFTKDIDVCCPDVHSCLKEIENMGINVYQKNSDYPIYFFSYKQFEIDLSEFRVDTKSMGRHSFIQKTDNIYLDAERRDLSCNAIYINKSSEIYDPFKGIKSIKNNNCKFVLNKYTRLLEDHLRLYRYIRFQLLFSLIKNKKPEFTVKNIKPLTIRKIVKTISIDRVVQEVKKMLSYFIEYDRPINIEFFTNIIFLLKPFGIRNIDTKVVNFININRKYIYPRAKCLYSLIFNFSNRAIQTKIIKYINSKEQPIIDYLNNMCASSVLQKLIKRCCLGNYKFHLIKMNFLKQKAKILNLYKDKNDIKYHMQKLYNIFSNKPNKQNDQYSKTI